ncbi:hypothetical protein [Microvirga sp. VF16]|uniref:hypothetical protein n=1 Tax=Microvirga sp. VF16 TaxID=2807101 RepID=UPI00193C978F|nr:hypothetical protein [Microvirga sp. VF16]QRM28419.1 hypothetical protein JO965_19595 [Microvirga sp. VF16]
MLPPDRGTRNLLPILIDKEDEIVQAADDDDGHVRPVPDPELLTSQSSNPTIDPALPQTGQIHQDASSSPQANSIPAAQNPAAHASSSPVDLSRADAIDVERTNIEIDDVGSRSDTFSAHGASSGPSHATVLIPNGLSPHSTDDDVTDEDRDDPDHVSGDRGTDTPISDPVPAAGAPPETVTPSGTPTPAGIPIAVPDGDDIHIVQTAFVDQDADVLLNGWMGESKIRVFMDNDAEMVQDADVQLDIDGNERMFLRLDQSMLIDQGTEIDLDIYEAEGVLYVDLYLRNEVDIVQDAELDLMMDGWDGKSQFFVNNDLDVRQNVDVDVDIEDELEEKFAIKVAIGVKQAIDADQDADIDINYADGGFGVDVDAIQTATIDQDTTLRIDFSVV